MPGLFYFIFFFIPWRYMRHAHGKEGEKKIPPVVYIQAMCCVNVTSVKKTGANFLSRSEHVLFFFSSLFLFFYPRDYTYTCRPAPDSNIQILSTPPNWIATVKPRNSVYWFTIAPKYIHTHTVKNFLWFIIIIMRIFNSSSPLLHSRWSSSPLSSYSCRFTFKRLKICRRATKKKKNFLSDLFVKSFYSLRISHAVVVIYRNLRLQYQRIVSYTIQDRVILV